MPRCARWETPYRVVRGYRLWVECADCSGVEVERRWHWSAVAQAEVGRRGPAATALGDEFRPPSTQINTTILTVGVAAALL